MSHFLGRVFKLIKEHKSTSDDEKQQLDRFEEHVSVFIKMETILSQPDSKETDEEKKERIEQDKVNIQRVDAQTRRNDA